MLQTYIPFLPKGAEPINNHVAIYHHDEKLEFYTASGPVVVKKVVAFLKKFISSIFSINRVSWLAHFAESSSILHPAGHLWSISFSQLLGSNKFAC